MKLQYTKSAFDTLNDLPADIRKAFYKQAGFLVQNLHHPSLRAKKYSETADKWQARVTRAGVFTSRSRATGTSFKTSPRTQSKVHG
jgi:mRNA-degrading endonuclease RelE of RelBE toxin-antitoxin system